MIEAGHAYIVKLDSPASDIVNPVFNNVSICNEDPADQSATSADNTVSFCGSYAYQGFDADNKGVLFLGRNNNLYYPRADASIGAFHAYFLLNGITANDVANMAKAVLNGYKKEVVQIPE